MFEIYMGDVLVGHSELERGDPPMGVAHGIFIPTKEFFNFQTNADESQKGIRHISGMNLKTSEGISVKCGTDVSVNCFDFSPDPMVYEVSCVYIPYPLYEELFPHHVQAYKDQFP